MVITNSLLKESILAIKNPRKWLSDYIPPQFKVFIKERISRHPHHNLIIPATKNHRAWILGAQPSTFSLMALQSFPLEKETNSLASKQHTIKIHLVRVLANFENVIASDNLVFKKIVTKVSCLPWFDHGYINLTTGKNQTVAAMYDFQQALYQQFNKPPIVTAATTIADTIFYCHCMAGRSRSLIATMAFIYFYSDKTTLFDFAEPSWQTIKISADLKQRLQDRPSFSDIAEFIQIQRPRVKNLSTIDGDQAGLLGLMALSKEASDFMQDPVRFKARSFLRRYKDAQIIGLMLQAPLDLGFREAADVRAQEQALLALYYAYKTCGVNLLMAMIVPLAIPILTSDDYSTVEKFDFYFAKLSASLQARFAILLHKLEMAQREKHCNDFTPLEKSVHYAKIALQRITQLTAGDQVELLRAFGDDVANNIRYEDIINKILHGNQLDRYNAEIQLSELSQITNASLW